MFLYVVPVKFERFVCGRLSTMVRVGLAGTHLRIEADENVSPVSVESRDAHAEVWLRFFQWLAVGQLGGLG